MEDPKTTLAREWLVKASHDLDSAHKLAKDPDAILDTAIYHCQQAAEKAIKGFLLNHDQRFEKTHDLRDLVAQSSPVDPDFSTLGDEADLLTPYAVAFRYPDEEMGPTRDQFNDALAAAERIYRFVLGKHPELDPKQQTRKV